MDMNLYAGERHGGLGNWILSARAVGVGLETATAQEPPHPSPDRAEHLRHLSVARPARSTCTEYVSRATLGRRVASGPF